MSETPRTHRRKLRNYLLDRKVQLRITLVMVLLTSALTFALGVVWYTEVRNASGVIQVNALSALGADAATALEHELASNDRNRLFVLAGFGLALAVLVVAFGIVMTHKLAGPLFKMKRYLADIEAGRLYKIWGLRKGDQLQEFFAAFERAHGALRGRVEADVQLLERLIAAVERGDDLKSELPQLREVQQAKAASLREASQTTLQIIRPPEGPAAGSSGPASS